MKNYLKLAEKFETINNLKNARGILSWDNSVMMPEGASNDRASQFQAIESVCHDIINSTEVSDLLDSVEENELKDLNQWQSSNLKLMRNEWVHSTAIDKKLLRYLTVRVKEFDLDSNYFGKKDDSEKKESAKN